MVIEVNGTQFDVEMYENEAARSLVGSLPQQISMSRWGDEFYGSLAKQVRHAGDPLRDVFEIGEVALWPDGNALCIFFGPTPASRGAEPRMASPGVALGKILGDASVFKTFGSSLRNVKVFQR